MQLAMVVATACIADSSAQLVAEQDEPLGEYFLFVTNLTTGETTKTCHPNEVAGFQAFATWLATEWESL